jgi:hypothetical protein
LKLRHFGQIPWRQLASRHRVQRHRLGVGLMLSAPVSARRLFKSNQMNERTPSSAAASLYPHLKTGTPEPVQRRQGGSIADAVFPHLKPKQPPDDRWRDAAAKARAAWAEANARAFGDRKLI